MPRSGSSRRTIISGCGFSCVGSARETGAKMKIHTKHCEVCKNRKVEDFDYNAGMKNGFNGVKRSKNGNLIKSDVVGKLSKPNGDFIFVPMSEVKL